MRLPVFAANWKMHKSIGEAKSFAEAFRRLVGRAPGCEVVVAGPFTALAALRDSFAGTPVAVAGQNVHGEPHGAYTGEISVPMLIDAGCRWVIVGHSERRALFGESDALIARKLAAALAARLRPIVCVGEALAEREAGRTFDVVGAQLEGSLAAVPAERASDLVLAYEPVWAIGTGHTATPEIAQEVHAFARGWLSKRFGADAAAAIRIQYGGSVKPDNSAALLRQPDIDGALVGGASLDPASFWAIIRDGLSRETAR